jgi:hypothetical protein
MHVSGLTTGARKPGTPGKRTSMDYWMDALRKTGEGRSTNSTRMNTFTGGRPDQGNMPYMSTSHYLRQMVGTEKGKKSPADPQLGKNIWPPYLMFASRKKPSPNRNWFPTMNYAPLDLHLSLDK